MRAMGYYKPLSLHGLILAILPSLYKRLNGLRNMGVKGERDTRDVKYLNEQVTPISCLFDLVFTPEDGSRQVSPKRLSTYSGLNSIISQDV
jgi:hypothetical protein